MSTPRDLGRVTLPPGLRFLIFKIEILGLSETIFRCFSPSKISSGRPLGDRLHRISMRIKHDKTDTALCTVLDV